MRILVVGGTGFIGSFVVRQLSGTGHDVLVFHRGQTVADLPPSVDHMLGDRGDLHAFAGEFRRFAPDVVVDMILGTGRQAREVINVVKAIAPRVVVASSIDVYRAYGRVHGFEPGPPDPIPLTEDSPLREKLRPHSAEEVGDAEYEKIEVERVVMGDPDLPGTVLRLPAVYGPGDHLHRLFPNIRRMDDNRRSILTQDDVAGWRLSRGYVENVAAAIALAVTDERSTGRIYNVADAEALTQADWVRAVGKAAGWGGDIVVLPKEHMPNHLRSPLEYDQHWVVDTTRIRDELGYTEAVPREEYLLRTVAWERANPPSEVNPEAFDYAAEDDALARWTKD